MHNKTNILISGRLKKSGITLFVRNGATVIRSATSYQPRRRTRAQFDCRERRAHANSLWRCLKYVGRQTFIGDKHPYHLFCALAAPLPALYLTAHEHACGSAVLLPGTPVSCGTLPAVGYRLDVADGLPALVSDLTPRALGSDRLLLVEVRQRYVQLTPRLSATVETLDREATTLVDGCLALTGSRFDDDACGWALVRCRGSLRSTQTLVTRSTRHLYYLGDNALQRAAQSYGGLTPSLC